MDIKQKQTDIKESNTGISKHRNPRDGADREPKRERKGEMFFTKSVPIVIYSSFTYCFQSGQMCQTVQKLLRKCKFFLESCSKSKKLLKSCQAESV